ncbi:hypothetical protein BKA66DRAFT_441933 [Pyrenochaeta sp. MPI-SDFR-AT-0127]|nr:hypothetical protein BKA66DRAFT_441933 [Pyrenochaeta sp. MPI-SDFR-AT-0127]
MGNVYSSALKVLVWLGEGTADTALAFQFMAVRGLQSLHVDGEQRFDEAQAVESRSRESASEKSDDVLQAVLMALWDLLERPWFRRVCVIQEVTLGSNVFVLCGNDLIPFSSLQKGILSLWVARGAESMFDTGEPAYQSH